MSRLRQLNHIAARDGINVPRPYSHCRALLAAEVMALINTDDSGKRAVDMIQAFLDDVHIYPEPRTAARECPAKIVKGPSSG